MLEASRCTKKHMVTGLLQFTLNYQTLPEIRRKGEKEMRQQRIYFNYMITYWKIGYNKILVITSVPFTSNFAGVAVLGDV